MKLTRLRILGFKTFVEATDFLFEPGLTGIVGPNGCGKSNLVEALRWVMGESSFKSMRASGMDDVIFSGSGHRPARNTAEVILTVDNGDRKAPAAFNDSEILEISRKIERESGSHYRINGREVRARDVQILFADAATGSRSPALVRQGQIGEIISAKPQARRRILEDAAGVAGLHSRRHEAELRLKGAEDNLVRLEDVLREIAAQADSLRKQARQAGRYRTLSADLRKSEALLMLLGHREATEALAAAERALEADTRRVADHTAIQARTARDQAVTAAALPALRDAEAEAAAGLQRLRLARQTLDDEERRAKERMADLERRATELNKDLDRERTLVGDAAASLERLRIEADGLATGDTGSDTARQAAQKALSGTEDAAAQADAALAAIQREAAESAARREAAQRALNEESGRVQRFSRERERIQAELTQIEAKLGADADPQPLIEAVAAAQVAVRDGEARLEGARTDLSGAREREAALRAPLSEAERKAQRLETEARTLAKLLSSTTGDLWPSVLEAIQVEKGFETALGAALGDDLDASTEPSAPAHWSTLAAPGEDPALPAGAAPMLAHVTAPEALSRRLRQIGLVARADGAALREHLRPGQRLVSREGDLWRWDGYSAAAEAPSAAARRLVEKNRLAEVEEAARLARLTLDKARQEAEAASQATRRATEAESQAIAQARQARVVLDRARETLSATERRRAEVGARLSALTEAKTHVEGGLTEAQGAQAKAEAALAELAPSPDLERQLVERQARVAQAHGAVSQARADLQSLEREAALRSQRLEAIAADQKAWDGRRARALSQITEIEARIAAGAAERQTLETVPGAIVLKRRELTATIEESEAKREAAADRLAEAETAQAAADKAAREALAGMSQARETRAGSQARLEAAQAKRADTEHAIQEALSVAPAALAGLAGLEAGATPPPIEEVERRLNSLRGERERLGPVNLRADEELKEADEKHGNLVAERDDLIEAIKRLRQAIQNLNREGRERLLASFEIVNGHFQALFTTLFGGGTAELQLVESDDPLEAGLEILARPPGKKPQTMTLLSGGEQALTAVALIFAVFLTNPSPICVLDEVDAPLDDANVERLCDLLDDMARRTDTRFVVITHNPITMARMSRLFGVTMAERGVSQLVSVDLEEAERVLEAS